MLTESQGLVQVLYDQNNHFWRVSSVLYKLKCTFYNWKKVIKSGKDVP